VHQQYNVLELEKARHLHQINLQLPNSEVQGTTELQVPLPLELLQSIHAAAIIKWKNISNNHSTEKIKRSDKFHIPKIIILINEPRKSNELNFLKNY